MRFRDAYLWIGVPVAILCVWVLFFYVPLASQIESKNGQLVNVERQMAKVEAELSHPKESIIAGNGKSTSGVADQIPHLQGFPDFVKRIALTVRKGGVTIDRLNGRFDDGNAGGSSALAYPVTEIDFTGRFADIGRVLEEIQGVKAYKRIVKAQLTAQEDVYPNLKGSVEIEFKAWRD